MPENLTKEEKAAKLANLEKAGKIYLDEAAALRTELGLPANGGGGGAAGDLQQKVQEEADAKLFDTLPPGERTRLYLEDRPTFDKLKGAAETRNMRRLLDKARP